MSDATKLQDLQWRAIELVNKIVECDASWEDRHDAIELVRQHLEARLEQTSTSAIMEEMHRDSSYADMENLNNHTILEKIREDFLREHVVVAVVGDPPANNEDLL